MTRLTVKEAAAYTRYSESTLNRLRSQGGGPRYIKPCGKVLYDQRDLDDWMEQSKRRNTSEQPKAA
jgi:excisionase family DNA binding protein